MEIYICNKKSAASFLPRMPQFFHLDNDFCLVMITPGSPEGLIFPSLQGG